MSGTDHPPSTTSPMSPRRRALTTTAAIAWPSPCSSASWPPPPAHRPRRRRRARSAAPSARARRIEPGHPGPHRLRGRRPWRPPPRRLHHDHHPTPPRRRPPPPAPAPAPPAVAAGRIGHRLQRPEQPRRLGSPGPVRVRRQLGRQHRQRLLRRDPVLGRLLAGRRRLRPPRPGLPRDADRHGPAALEPGRLAATGPPAPLQARLPLGRRAPDRPSTGPARATRSVPAPVIALRQAPTGAGARPRPQSSSPRRRPCRRPRRSDSSSCTSTWVPSSRVTSTS